MILPSQTLGKMFNNVEIPANVRTLCPLLDCSWQYSSHPAIKKHIKIYHKEELNKSLEELQAIQLNHSTKLDPSSKINLFDTNNISTAQSNDTTNCDQDNYEFFNPVDHVKKRKSAKKYMLQRKTVQRLGSGKLQCPKCERQFSDWACLKMHYEYVHECIKGRCEFCGFEASKYDVGRHIQRNNSNERYKCNRCEYTSTMKRDVKLHYDARHNGEKHICEDCGLEYLTRFTLQKHMIIKHSGIFLQCDQCDYKMDGQLGTMKTHKRRMHGDSKFLCIHCPYIANKSDDMEKTQRNLA